MMAEAPQEEITTEIDVAGLGHVREEALRAHETQVDPNSPFWFGLPPEVAEELGTTTSTTSPRISPARSRPRTTSSPGSASPGSGTGARAERHPGTGPRP